jgi:glycosyltransferase involved in cell wall biosynthesis
MRIVMVMPFHSPEVSDPDAMLARYPILRLLPAQLAALGHPVTVLVHAAVDARREQGNVCYEFIRPQRFTVVFGNVIHRWKPRYGPAYYQPATRLARRLQRLHPEVVHFFGLTMDIQLAIVARVTERLKAPLVVHYHGGVPGQSRRLRLLQRHNVKRISRVLFTTGVQAEMWLSGGLGLQRQQIVLVLETSSPFQQIDKDTARQRTGMHGDPVYLSAGRLNEVKDPLTMLGGFVRIRESQPRARLYLHYLSDEMLEEVQAFIEQRSQLRDAVELRGRAPWDEMGAIYSSADFLLQASRREWSGLAILEAMSCGCIPVVSHIPAFEIMTSGGQFGRLFKPGDADGLASAALEISSEERLQLSEAIRLHFEDKLSFQALANDVERVYLDAAKTHPT